MRILKFLFFTGLTIFLLLFLGSSKIASSIVSGLTGNDTFLPPMGKLLSPTAGFWQNAESAAGPNLSKRLFDKSLSDEVEILYDDRMVPHIFAQTTEDAFFAQGYATATLRLWQMEFQTHAAAGRLAEILGHRTAIRARIIEHDQKKRLEGLPIAAQKAVEYWKKDPESFKKLERYTDGVNAYINSLSYAELPIEYKILNYRPEPWTVLKTALLLKSMAETLTSKDYDFEMTNAYNYFKEEKFKELFPEYFPEQSPVIMDTAFYNFEATKVSDSLMLPYNVEVTDLKGEEEEKPKGIGSNNWAVSGKKTASGHPILCNDPHLSLNLPSIWFEIQIVTPEFNVYGASLPGAPGVISGFNGHIAWGVTNVAHDVRDWYAIKWKDSTKKQYLVDGKARNTKIIYDTIKVRGAKEVVDTLLYTDFGPVVRSKEGQDFVLRWTAHDPSEEPLTFMKLMKGKSYEDYLDAISHFACPAQNLVFACKDGDIALYTQGKLPLRRPNQGKFVTDGSVEFNQWSGFIPQQQIPHEHNPTKGFVASANQHSVSPDYPLYIYGYFEEYRGRFLNTKLAAMANIEHEDMQELQNSSFGQKAQDFLPLLLEYINRADLNKEELELLAKFKNWDYEYRAEEAAPTIFEDWLYNFKSMIYDEFAAAEAKGIELVLPDEWQLLGVLKRDTANFIVDKIDTEEKESIEDIVTASFKLTNKTVPRHENNEVYLWHEMKATSLYHLARIPEFSTLNIPMDGCKDALNAVSNRYDFAASRDSSKAMYKGGSSAGPSWRMIVELGKDKVKAEAIYPGGQSGNPGSYYYDNMIKDWSEGKYYDLLYLKSSETDSDRIRFRQKMGK
jgi:penicillin amidase